MGDVVVPIGAVLRRWAPEQERVVVEQHEAHEEHLSEAEALAVLQQIIETFSHSRDRDLTGPYLEALMRAPLSFDRALEALVVLAGRPGREPFVPSVGEIVAASRPALPPLAHREFERDADAPRVPRRVAEKALASMRESLGIGPKATS